MPPSPFRLVGLCVWLAFGVSIPPCPAGAQAPDESGPAGVAAGSATDPGPVAALGSIGASLRTVATRIAEVSSALPTASPGEREALEAELKTLVERREVLRADFESIATGLDPGEYDRAPQAGFVLKEEIDELLRPIIDELKGLTARPREIEQLRSELGVWQGRLALADGALARLGQLPEIEDPELAGTLAQTRGTWEERRQLAENRVRALSYQLDQAEREQPSFYETMRDGLRTFFRTRGLNFLLCVLAFFGTFFGFRFLHRRIQIHAPWMRRTPRPFYVRLVDVALDLFSLLGSVAASLFVLYATGDWVLMGIAIILLIGLALAARNGLPKFYDDARLLLNLGEIREGERVVFEGLPWRIDSLSFYSVLKNERLRGGLLRLPVRRLAGLISRPLAEGELWFPTEEGDWVDLPGRGKGRVVSQTPEWVQLVQLGGARIAVPTAEFLTAAPTNLSAGFRLSSRFGIDYRHRAEATTRIPELLQAHLVRELNCLLEDRSLLRSLKVEFAQAGSSSLDYTINADFDGSLAYRHDFLARALQRFAVDCCNEQGWEIPFPQITVHQAAAASA